MLNPSSRIISRIDLNEGYLYGGWNSFHPEAIRNPATRGGPRMRHPRPLAGSSLIDRGRVMQLHMQGVSDKAIAIRLSASPQHISRIIRDALDVEGAPVRTHSGGG